MDRLGSGQRWLAVKAAGNGLAPGAIQATARSMTAGSTPRIGIPGNWRLARFLSASVPFTTAITGRAFDRIIFGSAQRPRTAATWQPRDASERRCSKANGTARRNSPTRPSVISEPRTCLALLSRCAMASARLLSRWLGGERPGRTSSEIAARRCSQEVRGLG